MQVTATTTADAKRYAKTVEVSKRIRWDIDRDVIKGRAFDFTKKFLPDGLSKAASFGFLSPAELRILSQIQGRTYANMFGLVERFIGAKILEVSRGHWLGDQVALEALVRFSDEELKHQALFRRINEMMGEVMPPGYRFDVDPDAVARAVLTKRTWAVLLLTTHIELFVQNHYRQSIAPDEELSELFKDVFLFHWRDEVQHVVLDELEMKRHDAVLSSEERGRAVDDFIALVKAVDGILQTQAKADAAYFAVNCGRVLEGSVGEAIKARFLKAYRWQYIFSGATHPRFQALVKTMVDATQLKRIGKALETLA